MQYTLFQKTTFRVISDYFFWTYDYISLRIPERDPKCNLPSCFHCIDLDKPALKTNKKCNHFEVSNNFPAVLFILRQQTHKYNLAMSLPVT